MKIEQKPVFQPITLVLETAEEAFQLWDLICAGDAVVTKEDTRSLAKKLSNWFSNNSQMGGK